MNMLQRRNQNAVKYIPVVVSNESKVLQIPS